MLLVCIIFFHLNWSVQLCLLNFIVHHFLIYHGGLELLDFRLLFLSPSPHKDDCESNCKCNDKDHKDYDDCCKNWCERNGCCDSWQRIAISWEWCSAMQGGSYSLL